ncbi:MAG: carbohydrate porin [Steroidobacteraceae bacterium]
MQKPSRRPPTTLLAAAVLCLIASANLHADISGIKGVAVPADPQLLQRLAALEFKLQQMEKRTAKLEKQVNKPDSPDDSGDDDKKGKDKSGSDAAPKSGDKGSNSQGEGKKGGDAGDAEGNLKDVFPVMTLRAPFVVVDSAGKPIFRVADPHAKGSPAVDRGIYVYGDAGTPNFSLATVYGGGRMQIQANGGVRTISLGAVDDGAGVKVRANNQTKAFMGIGPTSSPFMMVYADSESPAAGMQLDSGKGLVGVFNGTKPVSFLTQSHAHAGGGNVTTTDPSGNGVFSAGFAGDGGEACVNRKNGMHCVGVGLPLGGQ